MPRTQRRIDGVRIAEFGPALDHQRPPRRVARALPAACVRAVLVGRQNAYDEQRYLLELVLAWPEVTDAAGVVGTG